MLNYIRFHFVVLSVCFISAWYTGLAFQCYSCSYTRAGTGVTDYGCVNDTVNYSKIGKLQCSTPKVCLMQTTYRENFKILQSFTRNCLDKKTDDMNKTTCTEPDGYGGADCYYQCQGELCNVKDGNLYEEAKKEPSVATGLTSRSIILAPIFLCSFLHFIY